MNRRISGTQVVLGIVVGWNALAATPAARPRVPEQPSRTVVMISVGIGEVLRITF